jgi:hypothetical protein
MSRGTEPTHYPQSNDPQTGQFKGTTDKPELTRQTTAHPAKNPDGQGSFWKPEEDLSHRED